MSTIQAYFGSSADECVHWLGRYLDAGAQHLVLRIGSLQARRQQDLLADAHSERLEPQPFIWAI